MNLANPEETNEALGWGLKKMQNAAGPWAVCHIATLQSTPAQLLISFCFHLLRLVGLRHCLPPAHSLCIYAIVATPENKALHFFYFCEEKRDGITQKRLYNPEQYTARHKLEPRIARRPNAVFALLAEQAHVLPNYSLFSYGSLSTPEDLHQLTLLHLR